MENTTKMLGKHLIERQMISAEAKIRELNIYQNISETQINENQYKFSELQKSLTLLVNCFSPTERFKTKRWKRSTLQLQNKTLQIIKTIKLKQSTQTTRPLMTTKSMVKSAWVEDMGQFLCHLDPDTRKITRSLEKL